MLNRRTVLGLALSVPALRPAAASDALAARGLDLLTVHRKVFASLEDGGECCWWYSGVSQFDAPQVGYVPTGQVDCVMSYRAETVGATQYRLHWREIGSFRDVVSEAPPQAWVNPATGTTEPRRSTFEDGPATYTITARGRAVEIGLIQTHAVIKSVSLQAGIDGERLWLHQVEDKIRGADTATPMVTQTVLHAYAALADVADKRKASVPAAGFYATGTPGAGAPQTVRGLMTKAAPDQILNVTAWDRMKAAYPWFFSGNAAHPW